MLSLVDSMAILLSQACQLARARLASAASPIVRLLAQRDQEATEGDLKAIRDCRSSRSRCDWRPDVTDGLALESRRWRHSLTPSKQFAEARVNSALAWGRSSVQLSVSAKPPVKRRRSGLDNWLGHYSRYRRADWSWNG